MQDELDRKQQQIDELQGMVDEEREYQQVLAKLAEKVSARKKGRDLSVLKERNDVANFSAVMFE
jgi:DNA-binding transcriptional regulator/RsmH inhibitor MraZ